MTELFVFVIIAVMIITAYIASYILDMYQRNKIHPMSFKESMDLTELPIITFYNNNKKLNFLLDSGSTESIINESCLSSIEYTKSNMIVSTIGMEGTSVQSATCNITFTYKKAIYNSEFTILDMDTAFNQIKSESGVTIHGIIGSKFFEKYKYVLDFKDYIAYAKN